MKYLFLLLLGFSLFANTNCDRAKKQKQSVDDPKVETITATPTVTKETLQFQATDGLAITADYYPVADKEAPLIILFHQAGFSRGEYLEIAPQLNKLGYQCLAIDQRSGKTVNDVLNETHRAAIAKELPTKYVNAIPDLEAALAYAKNELHAKEVILWGSSYSAALMFYMASQHKDEIKAILAFSPGEYFEIEGKKIQSFAADITCPVFVTSAKAEQSAWQSIYDQVQSDKHFFLPKSEGKHGSKALWEKHEGHEAYWQAVIAFLKSLKH